MPGQIFLREDFRGRSGRRREDRAAHIGQGHRDLYGELATAGKARRVTLVLSDEVDASRGNMLVAPGARPFVADQFRRM